MDFIRNFKNSNKNDYKENIINSFSICNSTKNNNKIIFHEYTTISIDPIFNNSVISNSDDDNNKKIKT